MAISTIYPNGVNEVIVPATQSIAISNFGGGIASIYYLIVNANRPAAYQLQQTLNNSSVVLGAFADGMTIKIEAGQSVVRYDVGASPDTGIGDADTLNGLASDTAATADTIAARDGSGDITANAFESTVATGTAPLTVASTTVVSNLNADLLDGVQNSAMAHLAGAETFTGSKLFTSALNAQTGSADGSTQAVALLLGARIGTDRSWRFMMGSSSDTEFSGYSMRIYPYDVNSNGDLVLGLGSGDLRVGAGQAATANATTGFTEYFRVANGGVANFLSAPTVGGSNTVYHTGDFDFEEGTFTPVLAGLTTTGVGTYTTQYGRYQKIGNWVHFRIGLTWTAHTGTGNMIITGLPYTSSASIENSTCAVESSNLTYTGDYVIAAVNYAGDQVTPKVVTTGAGSALIPMDTAATLRISGSYLAA